MASREEAAWLDFLRGESAGGIILMAAAALALMVANSPLAPTYQSVLAGKVAGLSIGHWINDGLMAVFFLLVGLEIKREMLEGALSSWGRRMLPGIAALGGMVGPALVFVALNGSSPGTLKGWAIPTATDIAFALGVLALLGPRVPASLKVFLTALAIIDDLGAVLIIALFYTAQLSLAALAAATGLTLVLVGFNLARVQKLWAYLAVGAALWAAMLQSGVHATLAGVVVALCVPLGALHRLEHALARPVGLGIVPVFGFANAGVSLAGFGLSSLMAPLPLGIAAGLFLGKQVGVLGSVAAVVALGLAERPEGAGWRQLYGVSLLCGIGFTMSLFIGGLAFGDSGTDADAVKIGVLAGSVASALLGALVLATARR